VEEELMHELAAGYALDALDSEEERAYETHLAGCSRCQEEVAVFAQTAADLAYAAVPGAGPPSDLRGRILAAARSDREPLVRRPRRAYPTLAFAAVATAAALGIGAWAATVHSRATPAEALHGVPLRGATGSVVLGHDGEAALVVAGLAAPPKGKTYELWVLRGTSALPAGLFTLRGSGTTVVRLSRRVPKGARIGVTVEPAGGSAQPTTRPVALSAPV